MKIENRNWKLGRTVQKHEGQISNFQFPISTFRESNNLSSYFLFFVLIFLIVMGFCFPAYCWSDASGNQDQIGWDVFGKKGGWFHAYLTLEEKYSDNIFYMDTDEESDFITLVTPGIWLSIPGRKEKSRKIYTSKDTPGGISISRYDEPSFRRLNAYFSYEPQFEIYADNSDHNTTRHQIEGALQYNLKGGLSFELLEQFIDTYDVYSSSLTDREEQDKYTTNLANVAIGYRVSDKLNINLGYSNFLVDYDENQNEGLNRTDHTGTGYIYFQVRPKAAVFAGYEFTQVDYDGFGRSDNTENRFYGGFQWDITEKSRGRIKAGYGDTDFDDPEIDNAKDYIYEIQLDHKLTRKTSLSLLAYRKNEEADFSVYDYILTHKATASYLQRITNKISIGTRLSYAYENYKSEVITGEKRKDDFYYLNPYIRYHFRDWFSIHLEYKYEKRDSNTSLYVFETNSLLIGLTLEI